MLAKDIMSSPVISIEPGCPVLDIAALLVQNRIGGLPVVAGDQVIGMVTESDLLHRYEIGTDDGTDTRSFWRRMLGGDPLPLQYVKSHGSCAQYVMTRQVVSVAASTPLPEIAHIFDTRGIGRVPVLDEQRLVGIVTCTDLLKTIAAQSAVPSEAHSVTDELIRERLLAELKQQTWWNRGWSQVFVSDGVVEFKGVVETEAHRLAARVAAENTEGVTGVKDHRVLGAELPVIM